MNILKLKINEIKDILLKNSIENSLSIEELAKIYVILLELRQEFLELSFACNKIEELEQIRFDLLEQIINVKVLIKEKRGLDYKEDIYKMKKLFDLNN